jgi:dUTP pyrophosphatase
MSEVEKIVKIKDIESTALEINYPKLLIQKRYEDSVVPKRATPLSSGFDVSVYKIVKIFTHKYIAEDKENYASIKEVVQDVDLNSYVMQPSDRILVDTGNNGTVGEGYEIQVRPRSGLALKQGISVENSPGTIDADYRGMIGVILINDSLVARKISKGDRIAQIVVQRVEMLDVEVVDKLPDNTIRGEGGFGHTGV